MFNNYDDFWQDWTTQPMGQQRPYRQRLPDNYSFWLSEASDIPPTDQDWWKKNQNNKMKPSYEPMKDMFKYAGNVWTGWRASNPSMVTPQYTQRALGGLASTAAAQNQLSNQAMDNQFAGKGLYGQGVHQAAARAQADRQNTMVGMATSSLLNDLEKQKYNDYLRTWTDFMQRYDKQREYQLNLRNMQMQAQMADQAAAAQKEAGEKNAQYATMMNPALGILTLGILPIIGMAMAQNEQG